MVTMAREINSSDEKTKLLTKVAVASASAGSPSPTGGSWHHLIRDKIGYLFFNIASLCTDPACRLDEKFTFLKLSIKTDPKNQGFSKEITKLAKRVYWIVQIAVLGIVSLFTGPIGMVSRLLGYSIQYSEFNYKKGLAKEKSSPTNRDVSVFFLNTCAIGGGYPLTHGGVLPWKARIGKISESILNKNADIVCLSEVYDFKAAQALYNKLKSNYSHFYLNIGPHHWAAKSGLFVASKYKIDNPHFIDFHDTLVHNKNSNRRGCCAFRAVDKENKPLTQVYSTHLEYSENDSDPSKEERKARKEEVDLIIKDIRNNTIDNCSIDDCPTILTGDLNFSKREYDKTDLVKYFTKTSVNISGTCRRDEFIKKLWNEKSGPKSKEEAFDLDHTFIMNKSPKDSRVQPVYSFKTEVIPSFKEDAKILSALSDHHAICTTIKLLSK